MTSLAADQADYKIAATGQAFRSAFELAVGGGSGSGMNGRPPIVKVIAAASSRQIASRIFPSFFTLTPSDGFTEYREGIPVKKLEWTQRGLVFTSCLYSSYL
jgi:hypothetical protein